MHRLKKYLHVVVAIALALAACISVYFFTSSYTPTVKVVETTSKLTPGRVINSSHITTNLYAPADVPKDAITNEKDVLGKTVVVTALEKQVLRKEHITSKQGSLQTLLASVAPGRVAVDLPSEAGQGLNGLEIGDKVNVYGEIGTVDENGQGYSKIDQVALHATILNVPKDDRGAIIIALTPEEEKKVADVLTRGKRVTLFLQQEGDM